MPRIPWMVQDGRGDLYDVGGGVGAYKAYVAYIPYIPIAYKVGIRYIATLQGK